jgi:hypothetical protein
VAVRTPQGKPSQAKPSQAKPSQAKPSQAKPSQAKPSQALQSYAPLALMPYLFPPKRLGGFMVGVSSAQPNVPQVSVTEIAQLIARSAATQPNSKTVSKLR